MDQEQFQQEVLQRLIRIETNLEYQYANIHEIKEQLKRVNGRLNDHDIKLSKDYGKDEGVRNQLIDHEARICSMEKCIRNLLITFISGCFVMTGSIIGLIVVLL